MDLGAFAVTAVTGVLLFVTNAAVYYGNVCFRSKMAMLMLAGLNMLVFEFTTGKSAAVWGNDPAAPPAGRTAAVLSLVLWTSIICCGLWIGFTTS